MHSGAFTYLASGECSWIPLSPSRTKTFFRRFWGILQTDLMPIFSLFAFDHSLRLSCKCSPCYSEFCRCPRQPEAPIPYNTFKVSNKGCIILNGVTVSARQVKICSLVIVSKFVSEIIMNCSKESIHKIINYQDYRIDNWLTYFKWFLKLLFFSWDGAFCFELLF